MTESDNPQKSIGETHPQPRIPEVQAASLSNTSVYPIHAATQTGFRAAAEAARQLQSAAGQTAALTNAIEAAVRASSSRLPLPVTYPAFTAPATSVKATGIPSALTRALMPPPNVAPSLLDTLITPIPRHRTASIRQTRTTYRLLAVSYPRLAVKLKGAWERLESDDPDSFTQAVHSLCELKINFLRDAAPVDRVRAWAATQQDQDSLSENGKTTRFAQALYLLEGKLPLEQARVYARAITATVPHLQKVKHEYIPGSHAQIILELRTFEAFVGFVLGTG